ncbi:MAG: hypothetical protein U0745_03560 [Polyangia bacterium]
MSQLGTATSMFRHPRRSGLLWALLLPCLSQCDLLWKPCGADNPSCPQQELQDAATTDAYSSSDLKMPDPNTPLGPLRKFEWRASIPLDATKVKYVGMKGTMPVFWLNGTPQKWVVYQASPLPSSAIPGGSSEGLPAAPVGVDFGKIYPVVSGSSFFVLSTVDASIKTWPGNMAVLQDAKLAGPQPVFRHPELDALAVKMQPTMTANSTVLIQWGQGATVTYEKVGAELTAMAVGDLDAADVSGTGLEAILLTGKTGLAVLHQYNAGSIPVDDPLLRDALQGAVERAMPGETSPIIAAFVAHLNKDSFMDVAYIRNGQLLVTSYKGRAATSGMFENWPAAQTLSELSGQTVKSLAAVDLTIDGYPELVVETESYVHFFLNKP